MMVKLWFGPVQPLALGVTVMVPVVGTVTLAAVKAMSPMPLFPRPMLVFEFNQLKVGLPAPVNATATGLPAHTLISGGSATVGLGFTVMVKLTGGPGQPLRTGVTVILATCWVLTLAETKLILPAPLAPRPTAVLSLVQLKVAPAVPVKTTFTGNPAHTTTLFGWLTLGSGFTVTVNVWEGPTQPFSEGVTVMVPVVVDTTLEAVKLISPEPLAPKPMLVFEFVQLNVGFPVPTKPTDTWFPAQTIWSGGSVMVGPLPTTTLTVLVFVQPFLSVVVRV